MFQEIISLQSGDCITATKVLDETGGNGQFGIEDEDSLVSDKALKVAQRISK